MNRTVVVHGATGIQGAPVVSRLHRGGWRVVAASRHPGPTPRGVVTAVADLGDRDSLVAAYRGADAVVVQLPLVFDAGLIGAHVANVLAALKQAGVERAVLNANAALPPDEMGIPFVDGRVRLARQLPDAVPFATLVAPQFAYMENLAIPSSASRLRDRGELAYPIPPDYPMPWVAMDDVAMVVAEVLDAPAPPATRLVCGPTPLAGDDAAAALAAALGREVRWISIDHVEFEAMLAPHLGPDAARGVSSFYAAPPTVPDAAEPPGLVRGPTTLDAWAASQTW